MKIPTPYGPPPALLYIVVCLASDMFGNTLMAASTATCFLNVNGTVHAILNWRTRNTKEDVILGCRLDDRQKKVYEDMLASGCSETEIADKLFPETSLPKVRKKVSVDVDLLNKTQLLSLIRNRLDQTLPSLDKLNTDDLRSLLASFER